MSAFSRILFVLVAFVLSSSSARGQQQCANNPPADYELTASSGRPVPMPTTEGFSYTRKNDTKVLIRLRDVNPYAYKCSVSSTSVAIKEPDISSFTSLIGGVTGSIGANIPATASPTPTPAPTPAPGGAKVPLAAGKTPTCDYNPTHEPVITLQNGAKAINIALQSTRDNQDATLSRLKNELKSLRNQSSCQQTVTQADVVLGVPAFEIATVSVPASAAAPAPPPLSLDKAIDKVATDAQELSQHLTDHLDLACRTANSSNIAKDLAFLNALISVSSSTPSAVSTWRDQLKALTTVRNNIITLKTSVRDTLGNRQNFTQDLSIDGNQQVVTYTATCTLIPELSIPSPELPGGSLAAAAPTPTPAPSPTPSMWSHDFKFGVGPRLVIAGGIVISPLQQVTFSTTATPGGSGATANTIIQQQNSSTRILPIAMLHARYWDQLAAPGSEDSTLQKWSAFLPNYFSAGVTAKSTDNNGTSIEYLFGPSWGLVNRQLFITAGAYAGHQQRLANSLTVGSTTSLGSANLPTTLSTIWKAGFAITWAPAGK